MKNIFALIALVPAMVLAQLGVPSSYKDTVSVGDSAKMIWQVPNPTGNKWVPARIRSQNMANLKAEVGGGAPGGCDSSCVMDTLRFNNANPDVLITRGGPNKLLVPDTLQVTSAAIYGNSTPIANNGASISNYGVGFEGATNWERMRMRHNNNLAVFYSEAQGTGQIRSFSFQPGGVEMGHLGNGSFKTTYLGVNGTGLYTGGDTNRPWVGWNLRWDPVTDKRYECGTGSSAQYAGLMDLNLVNGFGRLGVSTAPCNTAEAVTIRDLIRYNLDTVYVPVKFAIDTARSTGFVGVGNTGYKSIVDSAVMELSSNRQTRMVLASYSSTVPDNNIVWMAAGGTKAAPSATPSNAELMVNSIRGHDGTSITTSGSANFDAIADGAWSGSNRGVFFNWWATNNGSTTNGLRMQLRQGNLAIGSTVNTTGARLQVAGNAFKTGNDSTEGRLSVLGRTRLAGYVGIGAASGPGGSAAQPHLMELETDSSTRIGMYSHASSPSNVIAGYATGGTKASPTATPDAAEILTLTGRGYTNAYVNSGSAVYSVLADGAWSAGSNQGTLHEWWGTNNGSTTLGRWARLWRSNLIIGSMGTVSSTARNNIYLQNSAAAPSSAVDGAYLYSQDISAGNAALSIYQEAPVSAAAAVVSTHKMPVVINGSTYYILLTNVP